MRQGFHYKYTQCNSWTQMILCRLNISFINKVYEEANNKIRVRKNINNFSKVIASQM